MVGVNGSQILERLSVPGLTLLAVGAALGYLAQPLCARLPQRWRGRAVLPARLIGLALALAGAVILLDFIPGW